MGLKRPSYQHTAQWTMQGLMEPFSQNLNDACKKTLRLALNYVNLDYCLSLSVAQLVSFGSKVYCPRETVPTR